jgi:hypothetical protein
VLSGATPGADDAFRTFWDAPDPQAAVRAAEGVIASGVTFDEAYARLKRGRPYSSAAPRGLVRLKHRFALGDFWYALEVPEAYDPSRSYQVRVQLHGGVAGRESGLMRGTGAIGALAGAEQIYVMPVAWNVAPWWSDSQIENLRAILDAVKRSYNVDENRIALAGVSDGATGLYYFAMRDTTPYASFLPLNGSLGVLQNPTIGRDGALFPQNLINKPFFIINGGDDPLYPTWSVEPYITHLKRRGIEIVYHPREDGQHNTRWWPEEKDAFEAFVREHPRTPLPVRLTWQTDLKGDVNRAHWLVIDRLMDQPDPREPLPDANVFSSGAQPEFGAETDGMTIRSVMLGSSADAFGLQAGDVVTSINGQGPPKGAGLAEWVGSFQPRTALTIQILRDRKRMELRRLFNADARPPLLLFPNRPLIGRVDLVREGNTVTATTRGVTAFTLLVSPNAFDFSKPVKVVADGRTVFDARVEKNLGTLMKWAARDNDRTMLFGAEIHVQVGK